MEYVFSEPDMIKRWTANRHLCLFLDYDGTLTPIVERPQDAALPVEVKELLKVLSKSDRCEVAIMSGRALSDIKKLVGLKNITYIGNHGMEMEGPNFSFKPPLPAGYRNDLKQISEVLHQALGAINGIIIEEKGYSLCFHYRLVDPKIVPSVKAGFEKAVSAYVHKGRIAVRHGKMILEVRPPSDWDKGRAVLWLLEKQSSPRKAETTLPIYVGDDLTDEDAFARLKNKGITVVVGKSEESQAQYYLYDAAEVVEFLRQIAEACASSKL